MSFQACPYMSPFKLKMAAFHYEAYYNPALLPFFSLSIPCIFFHHAWLCSSLTPKRCLCAGLKGLNASPFIYPDHRRLFLTLFTALHPFGPGVLHPPCPPNPHPPCLPPSPALLISLHPFHNLLHSFSRPPTSPVPL